MARHSRREGMSPAQFTRWLSHMGWGKARAARELGCSRSSVQKYAARGAPRSIRLACAYLASIKTENDNEEPQTP